MESICVLYTLNKWFSGTDLNKLLVLSFAAYTRQCSAFSLLHENVEFWRRRNYHFKEARGVDPDTAEPSVAHLINVKA